MITDTIEAFVDISYMNNVSDAQIAPTASFGIGAYSSSTATIRLSRIAPAYYIGQRHLWLYRC